MSLKIVDVDANGQPTTRVRVGDTPRSASNLKYYAVFNLQLPVTAGQRVALLFSTACRFLEAGGDLTGGELLYPATDSAGWQASGHDLRVELYVNP